MITRPSHGLVDGGDHVAVVDLGFGDAGKGTIVDWLCARPAGEARPAGKARSVRGMRSDLVARPARAVIRFNGGAQAGHNVVTEGGQSHTFAQFGSGTLRGVPTHLSRFMIVDPLALVAEADHLRSLGVADPYGLISVDRDALVSTPYHRLVNQARELDRGEARHGSCGMGVGETAAYALERPGDALRVGDLAEPAVARRKLGALRDWCAETRLKFDLPPERAVSMDVTPSAGEAPAISEAPSVDDCAEVFQAVAARVAVVGASHLRTLLAGGRCVFEGAQGVLLDEWRGFHPYTTWSTTTFDNVSALCGEDFARLGVLRCFTTRHGAGPLVTEDSGLTATLIDPHNRTGPWQGAFRVGHFDAVAHRYAVEVAGGVDGIALTHLDTAAAHPELRVCRAYRMGSKLVGRLAAGAPGDLAHQADLTAALMTAKPVLDDEATHDWAQTIAEIAGAPVVVRSHGPTAAHKRIV